MALWQSVGGGGGRRGHIRLIRIPVIPLVSGSRGTKYTRGRGVQASPAALRGQIRPHHCLRQPNRHPGRGSYDGSILRPARQLSRSASSARSAASGRTPRRDRPARPGAACHRGAGSQCAGPQRRLEGGKRGVPVNHKESSRWVGPGRSPHCVRHCYN